MVHKLFCLEDDPVALLLNVSAKQISVQNLKFWFIISGDDVFLNADFSETLAISLIFTEWLAQMIVGAPHENYFRTNWTVM